MKRRAHRIPDPRSLVLVVSALKAHIPCSEWKCNMRVSNNNVPNLRYSANTRGFSWIVDIYQGNYFRVQVGTDIGEVFRTIPSLIGFLNRSLGVTPVSEEGHLKESSL